MRTRFAVRIAQKLQDHDRRMHERTVAREAIGDKDNSGVTGPTPGQLVELLGRRGRRAALTTPRVRARGSSAD
jgi:hypothetical protein